MTLESVKKHRHVDLLKQAMMDLDGVVGSDAEDVAVVRRMVDLAQRKAIRNNWVTIGGPILDDVRGVQQLPMAECTYCAACLIGLASPDEAGRGPEPLAAPDTDLESASAT